MRVLGFRQDSVGCKAHGAGARITVHLLPSDVVRTTDREPLILPYFYFLAQSISKAFFPSADQ